MKELNDQYILYSLPGCQSCTLAKEAFQRSSISFDEVVINKDMSIERFNELYPSTICCPFITMNNKPLGGVIQLVNRLIKLGKLKKSGG